MQWPGLCSSPGGRHPLSCLLRFHRRRRAKFTKKTSRQAENGFRALRCHLTRRQRLQERQSGLVWARLQAWPLQRNLEPGCTALPEAVRRVRALQLRQRIASAQRLQLVPQLRPHAAAARAPGLPHVSCQRTPRRAARVLSCRPPLPATS
jgi:hypothetical protein